MNEDEFERELRGLLAPQAWQPRPLDLDLASDPDAAPEPGSDAVHSRWSPAPLRRRLLAAALLLLAGAAGWRALSADGPSTTREASALSLYRLTASGEVEGQDGADPTSTRKTLAPGSRLVLGERERARITVGDLGSVELDPGTRVSVADEATRRAEGAGFLLLLERGTLRASIFAAPRLFQVGTPAGLAVDLGCAYVATVEPDGRTRLAVDSGLVAFETRARRVVVPAGAWILASPGAPPATPLWDDAPEEFARAVAALDAGRLEPGGRQRELQIVLATERPRDALTLWHLLDHPDAGVRVAVAARLAELAPPPTGVDARRCAEGAEDERALWWDSFDWAW